MKHTKRFSTKFEKWEIIGKNPRSSSFAKATADKRNDINKIVDILLENRGIESKKEREEFLQPTDPTEAKLESLGIKKSEVKKTIDRIKKAYKLKEKVIIYGDYDADGICATAILWENLYSLGLDVLPYIPERFSEGYGINSKSVKKIKEKYPNLKLIITVDNGIVANQAIDESKSLGIDVIISDHHLQGKKIPKAYSLIHTTKICGAGIAWILAREINNKFIVHSAQRIVDSSLELVAIGTVADQMPLIGFNRSLVKYGLTNLRITKRKGLLALFEIAGIKSEDIGTYEINYLIAPRLNAMGRMENAIESLRLLCIKSVGRARELALTLDRTNYQRQKVVDELVLHARKKIADEGWESIIIIAHESYHEGVIGLAAAKLVEEFYRPAIVLAKGDEYSKASARSISGFNIIEAIRSLDSLIEGGGGHPMAAGFTIRTENIEIFRKKLEAISKVQLTKEILSKKLKIDLEIPFFVIDKITLQKLLLFEPTGLGNYTPTFLTKGVSILGVRYVGKDLKHLKLMLVKDNMRFDAIGFNFGGLIKDISVKDKLDIVYTIENNVWNGYENIQLKLKDIRLNEHLK